jgi:hypothetical protein
VKTTVKHLIRAAAVAAVLTTPSLAAPRAQNQGTINVPPEEASAFAPIEKAATVDESIAAAKAFIAKYPKSAAMPQVEITVYNKIVDSPKDEKRLANIAVFKEMFPTSDRGVDLDRSMVEYYLSKNDSASIARVGEAYLVKHPDDVTTHYLLLRVAVDGLKHQDASMLQSGQTHGKRAIELLESATPPAGFKDPADWQKYKDENLGLAYQSYGIIGLATGDNATAVTYLTKATVASPTDPLNFLFLASMKEGEYEALAKQFNGMPDRSSADAKKVLETANAKVDEMIPLYAKAFVLSENKPEFAAINTNAKQGLEEHFKQRHGGKLDGLDEVLKTAREPK